MELKEIPQNSHSQEDVVVREDKLHMKRELGLLEAVAVIVGLIVGVGIFITPKEILQLSGSIGLSLTLWASCGVLSMLGALCYAELGTIISESGGDYTYIYECYGPLPAFLFLWTSLLIYVPCGNAIMALTFANYITEPLFPNCSVPQNAVKIIAALVLCSLTFLNCWNVKLTAKSQNIFLFAKIGAIIIIIITGLVFLITNEEAISHYDDIWEHTSTNPGKIALGFYSAIFAYNGWNCLNFMTEELKNPNVNLPRAIYISLPLITIIYILTNVSYFAVLTRTEMLSSEATAVTFGIKALDVYAWIIPLIVATSAFGALSTFGHKVLDISAWIMPLIVGISALGCLSVSLMTSARLFFIGSRYGHFPAFLSMIHINRITPAPSLIFLNILSLLMMYTAEVDDLVSYSVYIESFFLAVAVSGVFYLRWKRPNIPRPIKVPIIIPVIFLIISLFLTILPCYVAPIKVGIGVIITLVGIPVYYLCIALEKKPLWYTSVVSKATFFIQKLLISAPEE